MKPGPESLFQAIKGFVQLTNIGREVKMGKTWRLGHVHFFVKVTMKKNILHIELTNNLTIGDDKGKNNANNGWLNNRIENLI